MSTRVSRQQAKALGLDVPPAATSKGPRINPEVFAEQCRLRGLGFPAWEYPFAAPERAWKLDFAWIGQKIALEVQGGIWSQGRHVRGAALRKEWEKLNELAVRKWAVLYCEPSDLTSAKRIESVFRLIERALGESNGHLGDR
jgi:hypothetical protein